MRMPSAVPPTSSGRIRNQTVFYDAAVSMESQYKKAIKADRCLSCTNRKYILFCGAHFGFACGMCMLMGHGCSFQGNNLNEIVSVEVAAVVDPIALVAPAVIPPAPTVSAALVNGVILVTTNNVAANTPVQIVYDLTGDDEVIDLTV